MSDCDKEMDCPKCKRLARRDYHSEHSDIKFAEATPFWSNTIGCAPSQVEDERKRHPNWKFNDDGQVLVEGLKDQRRKVKELGMTNFDDNIG